MKTGKKNCITKKKIWLLSVYIYILLIDGATLLKGDIHVIAWLPLH